MSENDLQTLWVARHGSRIDFVDLEWKESAERPDDPHLCPEGVNQSKELAQRLAGEEIRTIVASPFLRTVQTASNIADVVDLPVFLEHGVAEWLCESWFPSFPVLLEKEEVAEKFSRVSLEHQSFHMPVCPETWPEAEARYGMTAELLMRKFGPGLLIVGHGATLVGIARSLLTDSPTIRCGFCSIVKLTQNGNGWALDLNGDDSHLTNPEEAFVFSPE